MWFGGVCGVGGKVLCMGGGKGKLVLLALLVCAPAIPS